MAIMTTKERLGVNERKKDATFLGITQVYFPDGDMKGKLKGYFIKTAEFEDEYMNYNYKNPKQNYELGRLVKQLAGAGITYDTEKMDEFAEEYKGTMIKIGRKTNVKTTPLTQEEATALQEQLNVAPDDKVEIVFNADGTATKIVTNINVVF